MRRGGAAAGRGSNNASSSGVTTVRVVGRRCHHHGMVPEQHRRRRPEQAQVGVMAYIPTLCKWRTCTACLYSTVMTRTGWCSGCEMGPPWCTSLLCCHGVRRGRATTPRPDHRVPNRFSGDTRPCEALVRAGMGASVLIHEVRHQQRVLLTVQLRRVHAVSHPRPAHPRPSSERATHCLGLATLTIVPVVKQASFNDDKQGMAKRKRHSTVGEACDVARRMRAKLVVLTHFSQR